MRKVPLMVGLFLFPGVAGARSVDLSIPLSAGPSHLHSHVEGGARYIDAPGPRRVAVPVTRRSAAGQAVDLAGRFLGIGRGHYDGHLSDPTTGAYLEPFGEAYRQASPVGRGLAPQGETLGIN